MLLWYVLHGVKHVPMFTYEGQCRQHHCDNSRVDHVWTEHFGRTTTTTATVEGLTDDCVWSGFGDVWTKIAAERWLDSRGLAVNTVRYVRRTRTGHTKSGNDWKLFREIMTNIVLQKYTMYVFRFHYCRYLHFYGGSI